jgi:hypothetical protein
LDDNSEPGVTIKRADGSLDETTELGLTARDSKALFGRSGEIRRLTVTFGSDSVLSA